MCNLYDIGRPRSQVRNDWEQVVAEAVETLSKRFGIRKTDPGLVVMDHGGPRAETMRWGFHRTFNPAVNNARSDKLDGMWKSAWQEKRRCLIPVETFYEWSGPSGQKQTFAFRSRDADRRLWAAGLWEPPREADDIELPAYTMVTTDASEAVEPVHHRMPVLLSPRHFEEYLGGDDPRQLLTPFSGDLEIFRCANPLKNPTGHEGPVMEDVLPGFEGL